MTGVFLCLCKQKKGAAGWAQRVARALPGVPVFSHEKLCSAEGMRYAAARARQKKITRFVLAGCPALESPAFAASLAKASGLPVREIHAVRLPARSSAADAARAIRSAFEALELVPRLRVRRSSVCQDVLIAGGGRASREVARLLTESGLSATVIEDATSLLSLTGKTGDFSARLREPGAGAAAIRAFGAVVLCPDAAGNPAPAAVEAQAPFVSGRIVPLDRLESSIECLPRPERPRQVAIVLDYRVDEDAASCADAMHTAIALRAQFKTQVAIVLREVRVSARGFESLYADARQAGVTFLKHAGSPELDAIDGHARVRFQDTVTGEAVELSCGLAAVSQGGLLPNAERELADATGVDVDGYGRLQENNVHLLPTLSNRAGVFVVRASGRDAADAAFSVRSLLSSKLDVDLSNPVVDGEKCALCLTCVRACPFKAMRIDAAEKKADCIPENCRRCGICAAACPARAITLPASSDQVLMAMAGGGR